MTIKNYRLGPFGYKLTNITCLSLGDTKYEFLIDAHSKAKVLFEALLEA